MNIVSFRAAFLSDIRLGALLTIVFSIVSGTLCRISGRPKVEHNTGLTWTGFGGGRQNSFHRNENCELVEIAHDSAGVPATNLFLTNLVVPGDRGRGWECFVRAWNCFCAAAGVMKD